MMIGFFVGKVAQSKVNESAAEMIGLDMIVRGEEAMNVVIRKNLNHVFTFTNGQWVEMSDVSLYGSFVEAYRSICFGGKNETSRQ